jgi:hypothetical protein
VSGHNARDAGSTLDPSTSIVTVPIHAVFLLSQHSKEVLTDRKRPQLRCLNWTCKTEETKGAECWDGAFTNPGYLPAYWYGHVTGDYRMRNWSGRYTSDSWHICSRTYWYCDTEAISELTQHNMKTYGKVLVKLQIFSAWALDGAERLHDLALNHHPATERGTGTHRKQNGRRQILTGPGTESWPPSP